MRMEFILEQVTMMNVNFQLNKTVSEISAYCKLLQTRLSKKGFTEEMLASAVDKFMDSTEGSNFNKLPSTGDLIALLGMKPKTVEQLAQAQCDLVFSMLPTLDMQTRAIFPDRVTNYVLKNYAGGFDSFIWDNSARNEKKQELTWRKKAFIESYVSAHDSKRESVEPLTLPNNNGRHGALLVDDKEACKVNLLAHEQNCLRLESKPKNATIEQLTNEFKGNK